MLPQKWSRVWINKNGGFRGNLNIGGHIKYMLRPGVLCLDWQFVIGSLKTYLNTNWICCSDDLMAHYVWGKISCNIHISFHVEKACLSNLLCTNRPILVFKRWVCQILRRLNVHPLRTIIQAVWSCFICLLVFPFPLPVNQMSFHIRNSGE